MLIRRPCGVVQLPQIRLAGRLWAFEVVPLSKETMRSRPREVKVLQVTARYSARTRRRERKAGLS